MSHISVNFKEFKNVVDNIYDTLVGNVGMSIHHTGLDLKKIQQSEVDNNTGTIVIGLASGNYRITVEKIEDNYFSDTSEITKELR